MGVQPRTDTDARDHNTCCVVYDSRKMQKQCRVLAWPTGNVIGHINEVTRRQTRLVLRWVTVCGHTVLVCNQPLRPTQPPNLSGVANEYQPSGSGVLPEK